MSDRKFHTLTTRDCYSDMFPLGTILWRATQQFSDSAELEDVIFDKTDKGTFMCRAHFLGVSAGWEPHVYGSRNVYNGPTRGMVVFMDNEPQEDWTHLIVTGVSKAMRQPVGPDGGKNDKGMCLFAKEATPYEVEDYLDFRSRLAQIRRQHPNVPIEEIVSLSMDCWPDEKREGERRLVVDRHNQQATGALYDYAHLLVK